MVGTVDAELAAAAEVPEGSDDVVNDLDIPEDADISVHKRQDYIDKVTGLGGTLQVPERHATTE